MTEIKGIVRQYRSGDHIPYRGVLKDENDLDDAPLTLQRILTEIPDGHGVTITVVDTGQHEASKGYVYTLTEPHKYSRITTAEWESMNA